MTADPTTLSDLDLLVERRVTSIDLFGYDTYKDENRDRAAGLRARLDALDAEAGRRGLVVPRSGLLTALGEAVNPDADPRVVAKRDDNERWHKARW